MYDLESVTKFGFEQEAYSWACSNALTTAELSAQNVAQITSLADITSSQAQAQLIQGIIFTSHITVFQPIIK